MWEKFKTSKERLEQCGWKFTHHGFLSDRFTKKFDDIKVDIGVDFSTYELYYIEISSDENDHCVVLSFPELIQLTEKIKELEVK